MEVDHPTVGPLTVDEPMVIDQQPKPPQGQTMPTDGTRRPQRNRRLPARYRDEIPQSAPPAVVVPPPEPVPKLPKVLLIVRDALKTALSSFGLWRSYDHRPSYDPDSIVPEGDLAKPTSDHTSDLLGSSHPAPPWPYENISVYQFMTWLNTGSKVKSEGEVQRLVDEVFQAEDFKISDLRGLNVRRENRRLDLSEKILPLLDGSKKASVTIKVPTGDKESPSTKFTVPGLRY